jgi:uncharacterized protein YbbK (DUF523 family)
VTERFLLGAQSTLALALRFDCRFELLTDGSPYCGSGFLYDGSFVGETRDGLGVTTALLRREGIEVFAETEIDALHARLSQKC